MQWILSTLGRLGSPTILTGLVLLCFPLRLALAWYVGVAPDEAYYFSWSQHLDFGYEDHPPAVAWLIGLATSVAGSSSSLALRLPALILGGLLFPLVLYWLGREAGLDQRLACLLSATTVVQPLGIAAGLLITPDIPLILCWTVCAALVLRALSRNSTLLWTLAGIAAGGALLSKHSAWVLLASLGLGLCLDSQGREQLRRKGPWVGLAVAILVASPNLVWDATQGFPSLSFQLQHGFGPEPLLLAPLRIAELVGGQIALLTPLVSWSVLWAIRQGAPPPPRGRFLLILAVTPMIVFAIAALLAQPEANWPAPSHPLLIAVVLLWLKETKQKHRGFVVWTIVTSAALTAVGILHLLWPLPVFPPEREPAARLRGWGDLPSWLVEIEDRPLHADDYELAAALSFHLPARPEISIGCGPDEYCHGDTIALTSGTGVVQPPQPQWFRHPRLCVQELGTTPMRRADGSVVRTLRAFMFVPCLL